MPLYTVVVHFSDHTNGIEQFECADPQQAVLSFLRTAESLREYEQSALAKLIDDGKHIDLVHAANGLRGFWIWVPKLVDDARIENVLGGYVVQTDAVGPMRN